MLPYIDLFSRHLSMYGVMAALGVLLAVGWLFVTRRRFRVPEADVELACVYAAVGTFVGAKLLSLLTQLPALVRDWPYLFSDTALFLQKYLYGGFVFYGGLYGALLSFRIYAKAAKLDFSDLMGTVLPAVPLIHGMGRLGCLCAGCCYGKPAAHFGIVFHASEIAPNGVRLFPTQPIGAAAELLMFALLACLSARRTDGRKMLALYLLLYGAGRFVLEFFRGDAYRGFIGGLSVSQAISLVTVLLGGALLLFPRRRRAA